MSRVFLAVEVALDRRVVVKVLPPEMAAGVNQERFRIQLAARLQHPHIVPLLSAGSANDLLWYVMPFIEGESLRVRLARQGELPVKEALQVIREIADALSYAHDHGVVHRDIKPDNVLISGRHLMVTDFGVAKAVSESSGGQSLTSLGLALGTPAYMAPEQAAGDPHVDHRADLYALGALGYEVLTGRPPFVGQSPQAVLAAHVTQAPEPLAALRGSVPPALNALVMRCLEKRPADRWQRADELMPHLEAMLTPSGGTTATGAIPGTSAAVEAAPRHAHPGRVAALFALGSAGLLVAVWAVVQVAGLPGWVFGAAIGLLLIGLPIMLFASRAERQRAQTGATTVTPAGPLAPLTTVRGAFRGGVLAFTGLGAAAAGFMLLRAAGIGPFATLVSAGVLKQRDGLLVADFENRSTDSTLGQSVTEALRIDLARSPVVRLLESGDVAEALTRMQREPGARLTAEIAREVAERAGGSAVVTGEIAPLGAGFVLTARVVAVTDGKTLLAERETADGANGLIAAVDQLSRKLRAGIGESLRSIRAGEPLELVTTQSLEALRKYTQAERASDAGRNEESVAYLEQAVRLDSTFAMAWRKLGVALGNQALDRTREIEAVTRAYDLRDRLPERERLLTTAYFHSAISFDRRSEITAYNQLLERWPDDPTALNNVSIAYFGEHQFEQAERAARRGVATSGRVGVLWFNLIEALVGQGRFQAADSVFTEWTRRYPDAQNRHPVAFRLAFAKGDYRKADVSADSAGQSDQGFFQALGRQQRASLAVLGGRPKEAERFTREAIEINRRRNAIPNAYMVASSSVYGLEVALRNRPDAARRRMDSLVAVLAFDSLPPASRPYLTLAEFYARTGDAARGKRFYQTWEQEVPRAVRDYEPQRHVAAGQIALAEGRPRDAITSFRAFREVEGCRVCWLWEIGQAFEELGQPDSARSSYQDLVTIPEGGTVGRHYSLPFALRRLGEMAETSGDKAAAIDYYTKLLDLWREAEPELQPRVKEIKRRIGELAGEPKS
jgi:tetratricopeptide (TPR) repeat protein